MAFLYIQDYYSSIQDSNLQAILSNNDSFRVNKERVSQALIKSMLVQRYDIADEFRDTLPFAITPSYKAKQLVYLDATAYSTTATSYAVGVLTLQAGNVYICKTAIIAPEAFTIAKWTLLGARYSYYYIPTPYAEFNYKNKYEVGDVIYWKNKVHTCLQPSTFFTHDTKIQYRSIENIPIANQFPDRIYSGVQQWSTGVDYSFIGLNTTATASDYTAWSALTVYAPAQRASKDSIIWEAIVGSTGVTPGTDITKWQPVSWTLGDNSQLVELMIYITLYKLSTRISPTNVPAVWTKNYDEAMIWLDDCAKGNLNLDAPPIQPDSGRRIRRGGNIKSINSYGLLLVTLLQILLT